jgi:hypothetical protein
MEATTGSEAIRDPDRVALWLASAAGVGVVEATLRRFRLPQSFDTDLVGMVLHAADLMTARRERIEVIEAWARRTLRLRAMDLVRSPRAAARTIDADVDGGDVDTLPPGPEGVDEVLSAVALGGIRRNLQRRLAAAAAWPVSASLTYLSVAIDGGAPGRGCPQPQAGADDLDGAHWAGLHYAGAVDCFATAGELDSPAMRQRRKRRVDQVRAVLIESYDAAGERDG